MLTQILLFLVLCSGSIFGSSFCKKRFEDMLPITCAGIVLLLFLCGTAGFLKNGVPLVLGISLVLWLVSMIRLYRHHLWKQWRAVFLTPAFCLFTFAYLILIYTNYGMMAAVWDEFSHWADIVKAMVAIDDFGTNPAAHSMFQSYPPGMSLFQYFFQKVYLMLNPKELFSEWRMYYAYQIFFLAFLMPFLRNFSFEDLSWKKIGGMITAAVLCFFGPMLIFDDIYIIILIDAFLGLIAGTGLAMIFLRKEKDWCYDLYVMMNIAMLVLAKDAGMLFAVFILIAYVIETLWLRETSKKKKMRNCVGSVLFLVLAKLLWSYNIQADQAYVVFSNPIDIKELLKLIFGIDKTSYRVEVVHNFFERLFTECFEISVLKIGIPYIVMYAALLLLCFVIYRKFRTNALEKRTQKMVMILLLAEVFVYVLGLLVTYLFKFSEHEAVGVASFGRYMNITLEALVIFLLMMLIQLVSENTDRIKMVSGILVLVLALLPWGMIKNVGMRHTVLNTVNTRIRYTPITEQIEEITKDSDEILRINVISQESAGYDMLILRYSLRPNLIVGAESIGVPFYEDDIYTVEKTAKEWQEELKETTDYVALYHLNDYFFQEFSSVFENPEDIHENGVYRVERETGMLRLYEG